MTICIVTVEFPPDVGGISTFYGNLVAILLEQPCNIILLTADLKEEIQEDIIIKKDRVTKVILSRSYHKQLRYYNKYFRPGGLDAPAIIAMGICFRDWLLQNHKLYGIDIIEVTDYGGLGIFLCDNNLPPVVITGHGSLIQYSRINHAKKDAHYDVITELEKLSFTYADAILPHSPLNQEDLTKSIGRHIDFAIAPWKRNQFDSFRTGKTGPPLVVAGMQIIKGAETLAKAINIVIQTQPKFQVDWVGSDFYTAPGNRSTAEYIKKKYPAIWNRNLIWHNLLDRDKTLLMLANTALLIIPSVFETFSFVAIEAATLGKPIIITDKTGAVYLFTHSHDAWIVKSNDPSALAEAIMFLFNNSSLCAKLGANAKKMIEIVFDQDQTAKHRINIYNRVIAIRQMHTDSPEEKLLFLKKYLTPARKFYYSLRAKSKKIIKRKS